MAEVDLSDAVNNVVVRIEGRRYPGLVVQGDRLKEWARLATLGGQDSVGLLAHELASAVAEYDRVATENGLGMGY